MDEPIRVLHVDDDAEFTELAATFLEREDQRFSVRTAPGASEGLDRLAAGGFDCVVSDYEMPGGNGIEFLEAVREDYPDLPFVLYTGRGNEEIASEAISAGVTDYIQKERGTEQYTVLANRVANAVEAYRTRQVAARHERINALIRTISRKLVEADARDTIERTVCETVAESEPYRFAWIGEPDHDTGEIVARTSAGDAEAYLDEVTIRHDDSPEAHGPAGRAVRTREIQVAQHIEADPSFEPWRDTIEEYGYRSVVVLPLTYDDVLHGVLAIYSDQSHAFDEAEQAVLGELAATIGEALGAAETRRRLEARERELRRYERMVNGMREAACIYDEEGRFVLVNEFLAEFYGTTRAALEGERSDLVPRIREGASGDPYRELFEGERDELRGEVAGEFPGHGYAVIDYRLTPLRVDGEVEGVVGVARDVTDRDRRSRTIEGLHEATRDLLRADSREAVAEITAEAARTTLEYPINVVRLVDNEGQHLLPVGVTRAARTELGDRPTYRTDEGAPGEAFQTGEPVVHEDLDEVDTHDPEGARSAMYLPVGSHGTISVADSNPGTFDRTDVDLARILAANAAATLDRIDRDREFREMETRHQVVVDNFPEGGVFLFDEDLRYTLAGGAELARVGLSRGEIEGATPFDLFPDDLATELAEYYRRALAGEEHTFIQQYRGNDYRIQTLPVRNEGDVVAGMAVSKNVTERRRREETIHELHDVTRDLFRAGSREEIVERVAEAAHDTLGYRYNVVRLVSDDGTQLTPVRITQDAEEMWKNRPVYPVGKEPVGEAFETGETLVYDDVGTIDDDIYRADAKAGMYLPIGEYGALSINDPTAGAFDETDVQVAEIVTANAEVAMERLERMGDLERQNERLEEFTDVVSHDLRNPLNVAAGKLELARAECDSPHLDGIADAHERIQTLIDDLLTFARTGRRANDIETVDLAEVATECWRTVATTDATLVVEADHAIRANPNRLRQVLENLFRNSVEHGSTSSRTESGDSVEHSSTGSRAKPDDSVEHSSTSNRPEAGDSVEHGSTSSRAGPDDSVEHGDGVTITVGPLESGFYVEDDGRGIPETERECVFESGYSTGETGTGFGLAIVRQVADARGWTVRATEGREGGARFEITGVETDR